MNTAHNNAQLPKSANHKKMVLKSALLAGGLKLEKVKGIAALDTGVALAVEIDFAVDEQQRPMVSGKIAGKVAVQCQRCLEPVEQALDITFRLFLLSDEKYAKDLGEDHEYWVVEEEILDLYALVEEEVLLAVPSAAYHESCEAVEFYAGPEEGEAEVVSDTKSSAKAEKENPFSVLQGLKAK